MPSLSWPPPSMVPWTWRKHSEPHVSDPAGVGGDHPGHLRVWLRCHRQTEPVLGRLGTRMTARRPHDMEFRGARGVADVASCGSGLVPGQVPRPCPRSGASDREGRERLSLTTRSLSKGQAMVRTDSLFA